MTLRFRPTGLILLVACALVSCTAPEPAGGAVVPGSGSAASTVSSTPSSTPPSASSAASPPSAAPTERGKVVSGLRAEIVPTIAGLFPSSAADPDGKPVDVSWVLRVYNTTDAPIVLRTGGDDEAFEIEVRGAGVGRAETKAPCPELFAFGKKNEIAANGSLDIPIGKLVTGPRCKQTSLYLTSPGMYEVDVTLVGHVHESMDPPAKGERGQEVRLDAPTVHIKAA